MGAAWGCAAWTQAGCEDGCRWSWEIGTGVDEWGGCGGACHDLGGAGQEGGEQRPDGVAQVLGAARGGARGDVTGCWQACSWEGVA